MKKKNMKYIVGIALIALISVLALGGCKKNRDKDKEVSGAEGGLQIDESGDDGVVDFQEALEENDTTDTDKDGTPDKKDKDDDNDGIVDKKDDDDNNDGTPDVEDPKHPSYEGSDKEDQKTEDKKEDDEEEDYGKENIQEDDKNGGWTGWL